jgi:hypothetical protein
MEHAKFILKIAEKTFNTLEKIYCRQKIRSYRKRLSVTRKLTNTILEQFSLHDASEISFGHPPIETSFIKKKLEIYGADNGPTNDNQLSLWVKKLSEWNLLLLLEPNIAFEIIHLILNDRPILFPSIAFNKDNKELLEYSYNPNFTSLQLPGFDRTVHILFLTVDTSLNNIITIHCHKNIPLEC